jgi:hypothetical protein
MARIVQQGVITTSGVSFENEPIVRSDGSGEIMQWQPSDAGADGVYIIQDASSGAAELGIGISPAVAFHAKVPATTGSSPLEVARLEVKDEGVNLVAGMGPKQSFFMPHSTASFEGASIAAKKETATDADESTALVFSTCPDAGTNTEQMTISSTGNLFLGKTANNTSKTNKVAFQQYASSAESEGYAALFNYALSGNNNLYIGGGSNSHNAATKLEFYTAADETTRTGTARLTISSTGAVTVSSGTLTVGSLDIGHGLGGATTNTALGTDALDASDADSVANTAIGQSALGALNADAGDDNTAVGAYAGDAITSGARNTAVGQGSLSGSAANDNTAVGRYALLVYSGSDATAVGVNAGLAATSTSYLTAIGKNAAAGLVTGNGNTAIGYQSLMFADGAETRNVALGAHASRFCDGTDDCIAIGYGAMSGSNWTDATGDTTNSTKPSGNSNIAMGSYSLDALTSGASNVAIGHNALTAITSGSTNIAIGKDAIAASQTNGDNVAIGHEALNAVTSGDNTVVGSGAMKFSTSVSDNVAIGRNALRGDGTTAPTGDYNVGVGNYTLDAVTSGHSNVAVGHQAGTTLTDGPGNVLLGHQAGTAMTTGDYNVAIGTHAAATMTGNSDHNIAVGKGALAAEASGADYCIAIGSTALTAQNDASAINLGIGVNAGNAVTSGTLNVLIGHEAGSTITNQSYNTAVGYNALKLAASGANTAVGHSALAKVSGGESNTAVGNNALALADGDEDKNTAIGHTALYSLNDDGADNNVAVGFEAARYAADGTAATDLATSVYIGVATRASDDGTGITNEIAIGYGTDGIGSSTVALGNTSIGAIKGQVAYAQYSDRRIKRDIENSNVGLSFIEKLQPVTFKRVNPADYPAEILESRFREEEHQELVTPAVEAAEAVYEDVVVVKAREAVEAVYENVVIPAVEEVKGERHKHDEKEVTEEVEKVEMVKGEGNNYIRKVTTETVTRIERTPLYVDHPVVNEDGTPCVNIISPAVEAKDAVTREVPAVTEERQVVDEEGNGVVDEDGNAVMETVEVEPARTEVVEEAVEAKAAVTEQVIHQCPVMEEYVIQEAQEERTERKLVSPAEPAVEEVTERRLVKPAVEAQEAVYKTVTVTADERPDDDDTTCVGLIAQDVKAAMDEVGYDCTLVGEDPKGKLSVEYSQLVIPLLKAVQELSAEVKALKG